MRSQNIASAVPVHPAWSRPIPLRTSSKYLVHSLQNRRSIVRSGLAALVVDSLLLFLLLQRRRSLLSFYGFLDESDDLALFG